MYHGLLTMLYIGPSSIVYYCILITHPTNFLSREAIHMRAATLGKIAPPGRGTTQGIATPGAHGVSEKNGPDQGRTQLLDMHRKHSTLLVFIPALLDLNVNEISLFIYTLTMDSFGLN